MVVDDFATITQKRMTGGFRIDGISGKNLHVDPGPGALVRSYQFGLNPLKLDGILISHSHTDHYGDGDVMIEALTKGMTRNRGVVIGSKSVIKGYKHWGPCISSYHLGKSKVITMEPYNVTKLDKINIKATPTIHGDPTTLGFQFQHKDITISYTSDTEYFDKLSKSHQGADILIASVIRPDNEHIPGHMCSDDFAMLVEEVSPRLGIMTHLGMKMILNDPEGEARRIKKQTGIPVLAARDGMKLNLEEIMSNQQSLDYY